MYSLKCFFFFQCSVLTVKLLLLLLFVLKKVKLYFLARQFREKINPSTTAALLLFETNTFFFQHFCQLCKSR